MSNIDKQLSEPKSSNFKKEKIQRLGLSAAIILLNIMYVLGVEHLTHAVTATQVMAYIDVNQNGHYDTYDSGLPNVYFEFDIGEDPHKGYVTDHNGQITLPTVVGGFYIPLGDDVVENQARSVTSVKLKKTNNGRIAKIEVGYSNIAKTPQPNK